MFQPRSVILIAARVAGTALLFVVGGLTAAAAQSSEAPVITREGGGQTIIRATRISTPLRVDGRLDDAVYREVPPIMGFIQRSRARANRSPSRPRLG